MAFVFQSQRCLLNVLRKPQARFFSCPKARSQDYYRRNRDAILQKRKEHYKTHEIQIKTYKREFIIENRENLRKGRLLKREQLRVELMKDISPLRVTYKRQLDILRLERQFGVTNPDQWYDISTKQVRATKEGKKILRIFKLSELVYPEREWINGKFSVAPACTWKNAQQTRAYIQSLEPLLHIKEWTDWYSISRSQLEELGASGMLTAFSRLSNALCFAFPEIPWNLSQFSFIKKRSTQRKVVRILEGKGHKVEEEVWIGSDKSDLPKALELDIWIPKHKLAIEYQGEHHYHNFEKLYGMFGELESCNLRDKLKQRICIEEGISLVELPYWWDNSVMSLRTILVESHPEIATVLKL